MTAIVAIGIDLAKNVYALNSVDFTGLPAIVRPSAPRTKRLELIASLPTCLIGMEARSGAHRRGRKFQRYGMIASKFVVPYRLSGKQGKNNAADTAVICKAEIRKLKVLQG